MTGKKESDPHIISLSKHLTEENPILLKAVGGFAELDEIGRNLGFLDEDASTASQISWWPVISLLGTFSAGKSSLEYWKGL